MKPPLIVQINDYPWKQVQSIIDTSPVRNQVKEKLTYGQYRRVWKSTAETTWHSLRIITNTIVDEHVGYIIPENQNH